MKTKNANLYKVTWLVESDRFPGGMDFKWETPKSLMEANVLYEKIKSQPEAYDVKLVTIPIH
jgi:hypothetical protein